MDLSFKVVDFAIQLAVILFAISFHESAHAWSALQFGDTTARDRGRISLNPIRHIDLIGSIILPVLLYFTTGFIFGYAKPTPVDLRNTKNPRVADLAVSAAGPLSNLLLAAAGLAVLYALKRAAPGSVADLGAALHGERFASGTVAPLVYVFYKFVWVNVLLGAFNLIPIPPLDGSGVLGSILGPPARRFFATMAPFGFLILILLSSTRLLGLLMYPVLSFFNGVVNWVLS